MAFNRRNNKRSNPRAKTTKCACGGEAKLSSRKNYPYGRKSKSRTSWFYRCKSCSKLIFPDKETSGRR